MKKKSNRSTLKIVAATGLSIFSLCSVFVATMAWFATNTDANGSGMQVQITRLSGRLQNVYFHEFDLQNSTNIVFKFNKAPFAKYEYDWDEQEINVITNNNNKWRLGDYSYTSKNHCMLIIFAFDKEYTSSSVGDMYVKGITTVGGDNLTTTYSQGGEPLSTTGGGFLGARDSSNGVPYYTLPQENVYDADHTDRILMRREPMLNSQGDQILDNQGRPKYYDYYALSSVASFSHTTFDGSFDTTYEGENPTGTIDFSVNSLESTESFTTIKTDTDKYVFNQTPYLYKSDGESTIKYVALIINYSPDAIGYIYSTYLGDSGLNRYDSYLYFACDWRFEVC